MTQMVRKQIYIEPRQEALLKRLAQDQGVSEAELIRQAIDRRVGQSGAQVLPDSRAWEHVVRWPSRGAPGCERISTRSA
jgi:hypothetical protein